MTPLMFEIVALVCSAFFSGAAAYITLVEHPARVSCGTEVAITEFRPSYRRGTVMQASLAILGLIASVVAFTLNGGIEVLAGGLVLGSVVPFTLLVIFPTNRKLMDQSLDLGSTEAGELLKRWGQLHAVRTFLSALAFGLLIAAILKP